MQRSIIELIIMYACRYRLKKIGGSRNTYPIGKTIQHIAQVTLFDKELSEEFLNVI